MPDNPPSRVLAQEKALIDCIERLDKQHADRIGMHIRISRLSQTYRRPHYIRMATDMFESSVRAFEGQLFVLHNHDLVFIARATPQAALDKAVERLRVLFSEDSLFLRRETAEPFCLRYRLDTDYDKFLTAARGMLHEEEQALADYDRKDGVEGLTPIQPELLARLEHALNKADFTNVARRQTVCTLIADQAPQPLFEEIYVSISDLQRAVTPGIDLTANPWLFQYLTQTLDKRLMAILMKDGAAGDKPFSINLNVASVLSPEFRRFDETVSPKLRGRLAIEFNKLDVFADMGSFLFARDYLHERGYRLCLDGLTHLTLPYYDRARMGFDLIKIYWMPEGIGEMQADMIPAMRASVIEAGQARTILCRCENKRAVEMGQQLGIVMFQGRYLDRLLAASRTVTAVAMGRRT